MFRPTKCGVCPFRGDGPSPPSCRTHLKVFASEMMLRFRVPPPPPGRERQESHTRHGDHCHRPVPCPSIGWGNTGGGDRGLSGGVGVRDSLPKSLLHAFLLFSDPAAEKAVGAGGSGGSEKHRQAFSGVPGCEHTTETYAKCTRACPCLFTWRREGERSSKPTRLPKSQKWGRVGWGKGAKGIQQVTIEGQR